MILSCLNILVFRRPDLLSGLGLFWASHELVEERSAQSSVGLSAVL